MEDVVFHTTAFVFALKSANRGSAHIDFARDAVALGVHTKATEPFFGSLTELRNSLLGFLETTDTTLETVDSAVTSYLSKLNHLLIPSGDVDLEAGVSSQSSDLNNLFTFQWRAALQDESEATLVASSDVRYEIVSILLSVALWKATKAAESIGSSGAAPSAAQVSHGYKLYQEAAGIVIHILKIVPHLENCPSVDCNPTALEGLLNTLLAEAESLTVLRASAKKNSNSLIAGLALDVHQLCESALNMENSGGFIKRKLIGYLKYKSSCFLAYGFAFHGLARLDATEGGEAMRLTNEGVKVLEEARLRGEAYDSLIPATPRGIRSGFHSELETIVKEAQEQAKKDNHQVYLKETPETLPEMPDPKRLVKPETFVFPPPDPAISRDAFSEVNWKEIEAKPKEGYETVAGSKAKAEKHQEESAQVESSSGGAWWRWLIVFLTMPLLVVITLIGVVVWIILFPVKVICCPIGCALQMMANVVEWLIKAPLKAALWASGKPWESEQKPDSGEDGKKEKS